MAVSAPRSNDQRRQIFQSVFTTSALTDLSPTPRATPNLAAVIPGQAWGSRHVSGKDASDVQTAESLSQSLADLDIKRSRAWHVVTTFLAPLPHKITIEDIKSQGPERFLGLRLKEPDNDVRKAIKILALTRKGAQGQDGMGVQELVEWYSSAVREHFMEYVRPSLSIGGDKSDAEGLLKDILVILQAAQRVYSTPLISHVLPAAYEARATEGKTKISAVQEDVMSMQWRFRRDFHAAVSFCLPELQLKDLVIEVTRDLAATVLGVNSREQSSRHHIDRDGDMILDSLAPGDTAEKRQARETIFDIIRHLREVGLGGDRGERIFAGVMDSMMSNYIRSSFAGRWSAPSRNIQELQAWIENEYARLAVQSLTCFEDNELKPSSADKQKLQVSKEDIDRWKESSIGRLGRLRVSELFEIISNWPESFGAVEDLKPFLSTPQARAFLVTSFAQVLSKRLLHPGISTTNILHFYILMILAFKALEPKGVLLDRVARPIRRYLRDRDDTIRIIVTGLLTDLSKVKPDAPVHDVYVHLAKMVEPLDSVPKAMDDDVDLDWDDMEWVPDPVDVGPDYQRSKRLDEFGNLVSLFESKEVFVREFQRGLQERLLKQDALMGTETQIIEMLKPRVGEASMRDCEVMIYDINQSRDIDKAIRALNALRMKTEEISLMKTKILSRLSWPGIEETNFVVPKPIVYLQNQFSTGFETLKKSRKLTWLPALGTVTVELELEDRTVQETVTPAQAAVIYAFQAAPGQEVPNPASKTITDLSEELQMDAGLVAASLSFWTSKNVLSMTSAETFTVVESLSSHQLQRDPTSEAPGGAQNNNLERSIGPNPTELARHAAAAQLEAKMAIYWNFIQGMLRNQGPQPLPKILMLLNMFVPGGHLATAGPAAGMEMLKEFLNTKLEAGEVVHEKGVWKLVT